MYWKPAMISTDIIAQLIDKFWWQTDVIAELKMFSFLIDNIFNNTYSIQKTKTISNIWSSCHNIYIRRTEPEDLISPNLVGNVLDISNWACHSGSGFKVVNSLGMVHTKKYTDFLGDGEKYVVTIFNFVINPALPPPPSSSIIL